MLYFSKEIAFLKHNSVKDKRALRQLAQSYILENNLSALSKLVTQGAPRAGIEVLRGPITLDLKDDFHACLLLTAVEIGDIDCVRYLIQNGVDYRANNDLAFRMAVGLMSHNLMRYFIHLGVEVSVQEDKALRQYLLLDDTSMLSLILSRTSAETVVEEATQSSDLICLQKLIEHGLDINRGHGLLYAVKTENILVIDFLLKHASVNLNAHHQEALCEAIYKRNVDMVSKFLEYPGEFLEPDEYVAEVFDFEETDPIRLMVMASVKNLLTDEELRMRKRELRYY